MRMVSNTSPLIAFAKIKRLELLQALFGEVMIPDTVRGEFLTDCPPQEAHEFHRAGFIQVLPVTVLIPCQRKLGKGEHAALSLALQQRAEILLLDDRKACNEANAQGIFAVSTRTCLKIAEEKGLLGSYAEIEKALKKQRFFLPQY